MEYLQYVGPVTLALIPVSVFFLVRINLRKRA
jgi:hypothetical protein